MNPVTISLLSIGLAADAFAVSISSGLFIKNIKINKALTIAIAFGIFQGLMPLLGWALAVGFQSLISSVDHWIAFGLLSFLGIKMIRESLQEEEEEKPFNPLDPQTLLVMSIATSIDALAAGVSLAVLRDPILSISAIIGLVTFAFCFVGVYVGHHFGKAIASKAEILGGSILIGIGSKILFEHLTAA
jgi:manganese efflux pump family protein